MKILKWAAIALAVLAVIIAMQPSTYHVERSLVMNANAAKIFAKVNDLRAWESWSPWLKVDPEAKVSYDGPRAGKGAITRWEGNMEVGAGSMSITDSKPQKSIDFALNFIKPMEGDATSTFTFAPEGKGTKVTWSMDGKNNFIGKAMSLVMSCDEMIGGMYEEGLANLKTQVKG